MTTARRTTAHSSAAPAVRWLAGAYQRLTTGWRDVLLLVGLGILARALTAALIHHPGYADAAYYYGVARDVAQGRGLTEEFIFTYLAPARQVVHPSNLYWMPGASLLLVPFFWVFGVHWWVAELPNVLLTGAFPALAYALGRQLGGSRRVAVGAGLLTLASGFYYPLYYPLPDNFGLYGWAAGGALLLMGQSVRAGSAISAAAPSGTLGSSSESRAGAGSDGASADGARIRPWRFALAGLGCGLAHLARAE
ncbi:MAG TPA: hypothetical protein VGN32_13750, partial [Ktedonobacterales bacterium]|nr:hypothetical protein [Ktedonobacterales bacterium]